MGFAQPGSGQAAFTARDFRVDGGDLARLRLDIDEHHARPIRGHEFRRTGKSDGGVDLQGGGIEYREVGGGAVRGDDAAVLRLVQDGIRFPAGHRYFLNDPQGVQFKDGNAVTAAVAGVAPLQRRCEGDAVNPLRVGNDSLQFAADRFGDVHVIVAADE